MLIQNLVRQDSIIASQRLVVESCNKSARPGPFAMSVFPAVRPEDMGDGTYLRHRSQPQAEGVVVRLNILEGKRRQKGGREEPDLQHKLL